MSDLNTTLDNFLVDIVGLEENLASALTILIVIVLWTIIGILIMVIMKHTLRKIFNIREGDKRTLTIGKLINSISKYVVSFVILLIILSEIGVDIAPLIASAGVLGLAIGFGAQSIVKDFISGFFIIFENSFNIGDVVEVGGFKGEVIEMGLRTTRIINWRGEVKIITNGEIKDIINFSKSFSVAVVNFGIAYESDLNSVKKILDKFTEGLQKRYTNIIAPASFVGITELSDSSIGLRVTAKVKANTQYQLEREIRKELIELLNINNIEIPYPQLVVRNNEN